MLVCMYKAHSISKCGHNKFDTSLWILFLILYVYIMQRHLVTKTGPRSRGTEEGIRHKQHQCTDGCVTWPSALNLIGHLRQLTHILSYRMAYLQEALSQKAWIFSMSWLLYWEQQFPWAWTVQLKWGVRCGYLPSQGERIIFCLVRPFIKGLYGNKMQGKYIWIESLTKTQVSATVNLDLCSF